MPVSLSASISPTPEQSPKVRKSEEKSPMLREGREGCTASKGKSIIRRGLSYGVMQRGTTSRACYSHEAWGFGGRS